MGIAVYSIVESTSALFSLCSLARKSAIGVADGAACADEEDDDLTEGRDTSPLEPCSDGDASILVPADGLRSCETLDDMLM